jgi:Cys-tRNA(Pro)/Cys-tRNA(Cys) deacylase
MKKKFPTYFEESAQLFDEITVSAGIKGCQLLVKSEEILKVTEATCADIAI